MSEFQQLASEASAEIGGTETTPSTEAVAEEVKTETTPGEVTPTEEQVTTPSTEVKEETSTEESFFDPKTVPQELLPAYKQMQAAFTKKTQEIAAVKKEAEEAKAKSDKYSKYESYLPIVEEMLTAPKTPDKSTQEMALEQNLRNQGYSDDAIDMALAVRRSTLGEITEKESSQQTVADIRAAESVDPRLNDASLTYTMPDGSTSTYGDLVGMIVSSNQQWLQGKISAVDATKKAIGVVDSLISSAKSEGKKELSNSAANKATRFPSTSNSPQGASNADEAVSFADAAKAAREELGV